MWIAHTAKDGKTRAWCNVYRDQREFRETHGISEEGLWAGVEADVELFKSMGWGVVVLGDMNARLGQLSDAMGLKESSYGTHTPEGQRMCKMLERTGLVSIQGRLKGHTATYTRMGNRVGADGVTVNTSELDYVMIQPALLPLVKSVRVEGVYSAQSDHLMLIVAFTDSLMDVIVESQSDVAPVEYIPDITKLVEHDDSGTREKLLQCARTEFSGWNGNTDTEVVRWMKAYGDAVGTAVPHKRKGGVKKRGKRAKSWHDSGDSIELRELRRELHMCMSSSRNRQVKAARILELRKEVSNMTNSHVKSKLARACDSVAATDSEQSMWAMLRCVAGTRRAQHIISQLYSSDGSDVVKGNKEVADRLAEHLEALGHIPEEMLEDESVDEVRNTVQALRVCRDWLGIIDTGSVRAAASGVEQLNAPITTEEIRAVISKLRWYKAAGLDKVRSAVLICLAESDEFMDRTTEVFNALFVAGTVPKAWKDVVVSMLYKKGDIRDSGNYRGISLMSIIAKVYEKVLVTRMTAFLEANNGFDESAQGSRKDRSAVDNLVIFIIVIQLRQARGEQTVVMFLDEFKAYPTAFRDHIMLMLAESGVTGDLWRGIDQLAEELNSYVRVGHTLSRVYPVKNGMIEGACGSPGKYTLLSAEAPRALKAAGLGVVELGLWVGLLSFVDDKALLAGSMCEAQSMLDVIAALARTHLTRYSINKTVCMQVGKRPENCTLRLPGMVGKRVCVSKITVSTEVGWWASGSEYKTGKVTLDRGNNTYDVDCGGDDVVERVEGTTLVSIGSGAQEVTSRDRRGVPSNGGGRAVVPLSERVVEVRWWEWLGVIFQSDRKWAQMAKKLEKKGDNKLGALTNYLSFAGALSPSLALLVGRTMLPPCILYGAPVWGRAGRGRCKSTGMTKAEQHRLQHIQDKLLRSVFGGMKQGQMLAVLRAEAGWCTVDLLVAEATMKYYGRVTRLEEARPVRVLLQHVVEQQLEGKLDTEVGRKYINAAKVVFGTGGEENLLSEFTKRGWNTLVRESMQESMEEEMIRECGDRPTGKEYLEYRPSGYGQAYWLQRAAGVVKWGKRLTLYRIVHMRSGAHLLGKVGRLFGVGDVQGRCACGNGVRECPSHFTFGCATTTSSRDLFYVSLEGIKGAGFTGRFRARPQEAQWKEMMLWLDGQGPFDDEEFDNMLVAFVDLVARLLKVHPTWG
jgi:hypothetical protein